MKLLSYILPFMCILMLGNVHAQTSPEASTIADYNIQVTITGTPEHVLYLQGYNGKTAYIVDSAKVKKDVATFKRKNVTLPCGIYSIINNQDVDLLDIIINQDNNFSVTTTQQELNLKRSFVGSPENATFFVFQSRLANTPNTPEAITALCNEYIETSPTSFLSKYIRANYLPNKSLLQHISNGNADSDTTAAYQYLVKHYFDNLDLSDPRLIHSPLNFKVDTFFTDILVQNTDTLIHAVSSFLSRCTNTEVQNYYHNYLFRLLNTHYPPYDPVLLYLYDNYDKSWIEPESEHWYKNTTERIRRVVPGAHIPELISHDVNGKAHSTLDSYKRYTILWFWDPDCDHCIAETPLLHKFYQEHSEDCNFDVFAVEVNNDPDRWKVFSEKNQLGDWINLSTSMGEANIDYIEYFDIMTTPVIFLIDNSQNHTIIARQVPLSEIESFLKK